MTLPSYLGPAALGIKLGVVRPGTDLMQMILTALHQVNQDGWLHSGDILCITESVLARSQNNYVSIEDIAEELRTRFALKRRARLAAVFPMISRNRFAPILQAMARATQGGKVLLLLNYPCDEVGNPLMDLQWLHEQKLGLDKTLPAAAVPSFQHPLTGIDYIDLYRSLISEQGASAQILLTNGVGALSKANADGIVVAGIHRRFEIQDMISDLGLESIRLDDLCSEQCPEWGLLGSNLAPGEQLKLSNRVPDGLNKQMQQSLSARFARRIQMKLAPRDASGWSKQLQENVLTRFEHEVEVMVYGDGGYKDPSSGIYELADPSPVFGCTDGVTQQLRTGVKFKYLADVYHLEGKSDEEIVALVNESKAALAEQDDPAAEGTTPRNLGHVVATLADLISGSADAATPLVIVKGFTS